VTDDDEINLITWENAARFYEFDPFQSVPRERANVGSLRALATDVDTTPRRYGAPLDEAAVSAAKATQHLAPPHH
jgi:hypothetical protein